MTSVPGFAELAARFAAVRRIGAARLRHVPWVQQMEAADCGAACLAMVLGWHGRDVSLREARAATGSGRDGVSMRDLVRAGERFGLRARGLRLELDDLPHLPRGSILHWGFDHFVVLDRVTRRGAVIVDPDGGRKHVAREDLARHFTGVALSFEPGAGFERARRRRTRLAGYVARIVAHRPLIARAVVLSFLLQVLGLGLPLLLGVLVDRVVPRGDTGLLALVAIGLAGVVVFHTLTLLLRSYLLHYLRAVVDTQLSLGFVDHLGDLPQAFFLRRAGGDLLARFESNQTVRQTLTTATLSTLLDGAMVTLYLVVLLATSAVLGGLVLVLGCAQLVLFLALRRPYARAMARELEAQARAQSHLVEMLAGMETLKALGVEKRSVERWSHLFVDELNVALHRGRLGSIAGALTSGVSTASSMAVLLVGAWLVLRGDLSLGTMLALSALSQGFLTPLTSLASTALTLQEVGSHIERIEDVLESEPEHGVAAGLPAHRPEGAVALEDVSFRYDESSPWIVEGLDLAIEPGEKVAIVGRSGAGKSTLARLLVGLYAPQRGRVLLDGRELASLDPRSVREHVGFVTQDARVFGTTIRENVALARPDATLDEIADAARDAGLHDEVAAMPLGYDTPLVDGGASLSGGQRQRIALARALLRRPALLILDEATSDLDTITEAHVMAALARLRCTRIVVAHRLSTVVDADRIVVLEAGRIVETGRHAELLARGGAYARLVAAQAAGPGRGRAGDAIASV